MYTWHVHAGVRMHMHTHVLMRKHTNYMTDYMHVHKIIKYTNFMVPSYYIV
jgi:hypothetical protein